MTDHAATHSDDAHHGPTTMTYLVVAGFLVAITAFEVWIYYSRIAKMPIVVPMLLVLSAIKFFTVVAFYMHLKYDHPIFRRLFGGPFLIAMMTITALLFLFGKVAIR